jgi:hypothetical protein
MKRLSNFVLTVALLSLFITSCDDSITGDKVKEITTEGSEITFDIRMGQTVVLTNQDITLSFLDVASDSRCPEDVICFWEGNAELMLAINTEESLINTALDPVKLFIKDYSLDVIQLTPATNTQREIRKQDYKAELILREIGN